MAILRIDAPGSTPTSIGDWTAVVNQLASLVLDKEAPLRISGSNVLQGAVFNIGGVRYVADADTAISGTPSDYVKITPAGATASASFVANLAGVAWNAAYKGFHDAGGNLYVFHESGYRRGRWSFFASGLWLCPPGLTEILVSGIGGGGDGGLGGSGYANAGTGGGAGAGGSGAFVDRIPIAVVPGTLYTVTVGKGVASTLGALLSLAAGGNGSPGGNGTASAGGAGGAPGAAGAGTGISKAGTAGVAGTAGGMNSGTQAGGNGGAAGKCGLYNAHDGAAAGAGGAGAIGNAGADAADYGGGGGGGGGGGHTSGSGFAGGAGGAGKTGFLILEASAAR